MELDTIRNDFPAGVEGVDEQVSLRCQLRADADWEREVSIPGCGNRQFTDDTVLAIACLSMQVKRGLIHR